jgi:hypothetical protein
MGEQKGPTMTDLQLSTQIKDRVFEYLDSFSVVGSTQDGNVIMLSFFDGSDESRRRLLQMVRALERKLVENGRRH